MRVIEGLASGRGASIPVIVRRRNELAQLLRARVAAHGRAQARKAAEDLIRQRPESIEASPASALELDEGSYSPYVLFEGHRFRKHAFELVGWMNNDEKECAIRIDDHPNVRRWVRNLDRETQNGFWLPKSPGKFFPDFIVELNDGKIVAAEYKNAGLASQAEEQHKRAVGELWARRSDSTCRFAWVVERDWGELERQLAS